MHPSLMPWRKGRDVDSDDDDDDIDVDDENDGDDDEDDEDDKDIASSDEDLNFFILSGTTDYGVEVWEI